MLGENMRHESGATCRNLSCSIGFVRFWVLQGSISALLCLKKMCSLDYLGTAFKVSTNCLICPAFAYATFQILDEINPPTKLLGKFLRTWEEREKKIAQYSIIAPPSSSVDGQEPADVALALSKRLIAA